MATKLTLRLDEGLIERAKREARKRGTSLSGMVAGYFQGITAPKWPENPPMNTESSTSQSQMGLSTAGL